MTRDHGYWDHDDYTSNPAAASASAAAHDLGDVDRELAIAAERADIREEQRREEQEARARRWRR